MDKVTYEYVIRGEPASKKNSNQIVRIHGVPRIINNKNYLAYKERAAVDLANRQTDMPIFFPVKITCTYYRSSKRRVDKTNLESAVCDVLVENHIIADDCRDIAADICGNVLYDKSEPRTEITIESLPIGSYEVWNRELRVAGEEQLKRYLTE